MFKVGDWLLAGMPSAQIDMFSFPVCRTGRLDEGLREVRFTLLKIKFQFSIQTLITHIFITFKWRLSCYAFDYAQSALKSYFEKRERRLGVIEVKVIVYRNVYPNPTVVA